MEAGLVKDEEAEKLFSPLTIDDMTSTSDIAKQFNERLQGIQKWVTKVVDTKTTSVKTDLEATAKEDEFEKIRKFAETHPELKPGSDVAAMMEQLYAKNKDLETIYKKACLASDVKPIAISDGKNVNLATGKAVKEDGTEEETKVKKDDDADLITSLRSDINNATSEDVDDGSLKKDKDIEGKSVREIAGENWNKALADAGVSDLPE